MSNTTKPISEVVPQSREKVDDFLKRAASGDDSTLPVIRQLIAEGGLTESLGNLAKRIQWRIIENLAGKDLITKESVSSKMDNLRNELSGESASALERLLADRIVVCWLSLHDAEIRFAQQVKELTIAQAEYWQNRIDRAHRRYLSAIKSLATVRKLAAPVLQVNIAQRQTNIAGT